MAMSTSTSTQVQTAMAKRSNRYVVVDTFRGLAYSWAGVIFGMIEYFSNLEQDGVWLAFVKMLYIRKYCITSNLNLANSFIGAHQ